MTFGSINCQLNTRRAAIKGILVTTAAWLGFRELKAESSVNKTIKKNTRGIKAQTEHVLNEMDMELSKVWGSSTGPDNHCHIWGRSGRLLG